MNISRITTMLVAIATQSCDLFAEESFQIALTKPQFLLYEPIPVSLTWRADTTQKHRPSRTHPPRAIQGHLMQGDEVVADLFLTGGGLGYSGAASVAHADMIGLIGIMNPAPREAQPFTFWGVPGDYEILVLEVDGTLRSNRVPITLLRPFADEAEAAKLFISDGIGVLPMLVGLEFAGKRSTESLRRLAEQFPHTVYGKYALAATMRTMVRHTSERTAPSGPMTAQERAEFKEAMTWFGPRNAMYNLLRLDLLTSQIKADNADFDAIYKEYIVDVRDGVMLHEARMTKDKRERSLSRTGDK